MAFLSKRKRKKLRRHSESAVERREQKREKTDQFDGAALNEKNVLLSHLVLCQEGVVDLCADVEERVAHPKDALLERHFGEEEGGVRAGGE